MLIPVETLFLITLHSSASVIVAVHVDESVTFAKSGRGCADKVDASPGGVSHQIHAIHDSLFHLADVISEISDAVIVFYGHLAICTLNQLIKRTKTILHDKQWFLVAVPECVQNIAEVPFGSICQPQSLAFRYGFGTPPRRFPSPRTFFSGSAVAQTLT